MGEGKIKAHKVSGEIINLLEVFTPEFMKSKGIVPTDDRRFYFQADPDKHAFYVSRLAGEFRIASEDSRLVSSWYSLSTVEANPLPALAKRLGESARQLAYRRTVQKVSEQEPVLSCFLDYLRTSMTGPIYKIRCEYPTKGCAEYAWDFWSANWPSERDALDFDSRCREKIERIKLQAGDLQNRLLLSLHEAGIHISNVGQDWLQLGEDPETGNPICLCIYAEHNALSLELWDPNTGASIKGTAPGQNLKVVIQPEAAKALKPILSNCWELLPDILATVTAGGQYRRPEAVKLQTMDTDLDLV